MAKRGTFSLTLATFAAKATNNAYLVIRKTLFDILGRIVLRSPVDEGRFRANWQVTIGAPASGTLDVTDKTGLATITNGARMLEKFKGGGGSLWIVNNLPYAIALEYGWSKQAPAGMVRVTQREYVSLIARNAQAVR